jgi:hypothetical protein
MVVSRIYARSRPPLRCQFTRVLTVSKLRNAELKGKGGKGVRRERGRGGPGENLKGELCASVHGRAGGVGSYREGELRWLIRLYAP